MGIVRTTGQTRKDKFVRIATSEMNVQPVGEVAWDGKIPPSVAGLQRADHLPFPLPPPGPLAHLHVWPITFQLEVANRERQQLRATHPGCG
ncbi:MAG: hypothetical protein ACLP4R_25545 [Solirubrobacteraceae bacterium]